jgi:hypothetical protein
VLVAGVASDRRLCTAVAYAAGTLESRRSCSMACAAPRLSREDAGDTGDFWDFGDVGEPGLSGLPMDVGDKRPSSSDPWPEGTTESVGEPALELPLRWGLRVEAFLPPAWAIAATARTLEAFFQPD